VIGAAVKLWSVEDVVGPADGSQVNEGPIKKSGVGAMPNEPDGFAREDLVLIGLLGVAAVAGLLLFFYLFPLTPQPNSN
jgi:hypothetical protein